MKKVKVSKTNFVGKNENVGDKNALKDLGEKIDEVNKKIKAIKLEYLALRDKGMIKKLKEKLSIS